MKVYTPKDAELNSRSIPDFVFDVFNNLLAEKWNNSREIIITQDEAIEAILSKYRSEYNVEMSRSTVFEKHWLDVEPEYRKAGWIVKYDKPAYCEFYKAYFTFIPETN